MKQIHVNKTAIPGVFTFFNLLFGFLAILQSALGSFGKAAWLILAASLFDGLDGATARLLKVPSNFGKQFDSAADLVSFCAAPAVLLYFAYTEGMHPFLGAMISFIPLFAGAFRLARFTVQSDDAPKHFFMGLSSTAHALTFASFVLFNQGIYGSPGDPRIALLLALLLSLLMVSHIPYAKYIGVNWHGRMKVVALMLCVGALTFWKSLILFPLAVLYVTGGIVKTFLHHDEAQIEAKVVPKRRFFKRK